MNKMSFYASDSHIHALSSLKTIPFAKTDDGYRFAHWVYDLNYKEEEHEVLLNSPHGKEIDQLINEAKSAMENILVTEDDYLGWTVHKKDAGGIAEYHKIIRELSIQMLMLEIDTTADDVVKESHKRDDSFYIAVSGQNQSKTKQVLNRHNPFADVSIKEQQFFYKATDGSTETLFFNTNNIVEKKDKNGRDMITMRPSFSVTKEHGVVHRPMQKVTFSSTMTEPIVSDEDHIYIHID